MNKILKILEWLLVLYLGIMFIENCIYISLALSQILKFSFGIQFFINFYLPNLILIGILPIFLFFTIRNIKKLKWHTLIIVFILTLIIPKEHPFLTNVNDYGLGVLFESKKRVLYDDIIAQQNQYQADSSQTVIKLENIYRFNYKNGKIKRKGKLIESKQFAPNGNVILTNNTKFFYNSNNQIIKKLIQYSKNRCDTTYYYYSKDSLCLGSKMFYKDYITKTENKYDSHKNLIYSCTQLDDSIIDSFKYIYNENQQKVKSIFQSTNSSEPSITEYIYSDSSMTEINYVDEDSIRNKIYFKFDSIGNWVEQSFFSNEGEKSTTYYYYDSENRKIKETSELQSRNIEKNWKYDNNGLIISEIESDDSGDLKEINYLYDSNGRLIKKTVMDKKSEETSWIELTTYEYFNNN
jgi:hypothetical protein